MAYSKQIIKIKIKDIYGYDDFQYFAIMNSKKTLFGNTKYLTEPYGMCNYTRGPIWRRLKKSDIIISEKQYEKEEKLK